MSRVANCLESVEISEVRRERPAILARDFQPIEAEALRAGPARTVAGFVALKRALVALARSLAPGVEASARDFALGHDAGGAPIVTSLPRGVEALLRRGRLRVSISHTSTTAHGLAAFQEASDG